MLQSLSIRNLAIIDELHLHLSSGFVVFTGETGAGKSILVEAISLLLGDRAHNDDIRDGEQKAEIIACFDISKLPTLLTVLQEWDIDIDETQAELFIRRTIRRDGPSRAWLNEVPVSMQTLQRVGSMLVDIHGQHAHQSLLKSDRQLRILDSLGVSETLLARVRQHAEEWQDANQKLQAICLEDTGTIDLLHYQLEELQNFHPGADEYDSLVQQHQRLNNIQNIQEILQQGMDSLTENDDTVSGRLHTLQRQLDSISKHEPIIATIQELLDTAMIQLSEAGNEMRHLLEHAEVDPEALSQVEKRLESWHTLARKHKVTAAELPARLQQLTTKLTSLQQHSKELQDYEKKRDTALLHWQQAAAELHEVRDQCGQQLAAQLGHWMQELGMPNGVFEVSVEYMPEIEPRISGANKVHFRVSTNLGQKPRPLQKTASGGELSRISLAIQIVASKDSGIPTLIYDEVDAGIGGDTARTVGKLLLQLGSNYQVLCVSHQASIASMANAHYVVTKKQEAKQTTIAVTSLNEEQRIAEIARMISGKSSSSAAAEHARSLLQEAGT